MKLSVIYRPSVPASASPYRLLDAQDHEIAWVNDFLDARRVQQQSLRSLRAYAYDLLHFARWWLRLPARPLSDITLSTLYDYVRDQLDQKPKPSTVNHRLVVVRCLYRFHYGREIPATGSHDLPPSSRSRSSSAYGRPYRTRAAGPRLRQPRRVIVPLTEEEVATFWQSFRTFRDLALVGLMLLIGLRSCEVLHLHLEDLQLTGGQIRVTGKGDKQRVLPLPAEIIEVLEKYFRWERPLTNSPYLFVSLKGRQRGRPMTPAGLRSLFRHHRAGSRVRHANPHRFRHTFGADMLRDGISLPALQHLMGHSQIQTTMIYAQLAPRDVWREYAQAVAKRKPLGSSQIL